MKKQLPWGVCALILALSGIHTIFYVQPLEKQHAAVKKHVTHLEEAKSTLERELQESRETTAGWQAQTERFKTLCRILAQYAFEEFRLRRSMLSGLEVVGFFTDQVVAKTTKEEPDLDPRFVIINVSEGLRPFIVKE
ncbi:MAG TPA: hypothetical protein VEC13_00785 [Candidatus Paceibacterota bacterium]|nr:hypothetical protein [Candidatus Paceibacterota bacterium]